MNRQRDTDGQDGLSTVPGHDPRRDVVYNEREVEDDPDQEEPCLPDGTPIFKSRKITRQEQLQGLADRGCDTWEEYRGER